MLVCAVVAAVLLTTWGSAQDHKQTAGATDRVEELNSLHGELDSVNRDLRGLQELYSQNPKLAEAKRAASKARAAVDTIAAELRQTDGEAEAVTEEYRAQQLRVGELGRKRTVIRARIERMPEMLAARRARDKARAEAQALERAAIEKYEALYRSKLQNSPEWTHVDDEITELQRQEYSLRYRVRGLERRAAQAPEVIDAANALALAERIYADRLREAVAATVKGKVALVVTDELSAQRRKLEQHLELLRRKLAEGPQLAKLRKTMSQCRQRRTETDTACRRLVESKLRANGEALELRALMHGVHSGLRNEMEKRLEEIQKAIGKQADVVAADKARSEAGRAHESAFNAYETKLRAVVATHPDAAAPNAMLQEMRDAMYRVKEFQEAVQSTNRQVIAAYDAKEQAEQELKRAREGVAEKARQIVANDPEGASLLKRRSELEERIRRLEGK